MSIPRTKTCRTCGVAKPLDAYYAQGTKDADCKECKKAKLRAQRQANPEGVRAAQRARRAANPEKYRETARLYAEKNRERRRECDRARYQRNPEQKKASVAKWRRSNPQKVAVTNRDWQTANKERWKQTRAKRQHIYNAKGRERYATDAEWREHLKQYARDWSKANPEKRMLQHQRRRARASNGHFTAGQWRSLKAWFGSKCLRCGAAEKLTPDHVIPLALGGSNTIDNIQPLCFGCNASKQAKYVDYRNPERLREFLALL